MDRRRVATSAAEGRTMLPRWLPPVPVPHDRCGYSHIVHETRLLLPPPIVMEPPMTRTDRQPPLFTFSAAFNHQRESPKLSHICTSGHKQDLKQHA